MNITKAFNTCFYFYVLGGAAAADVEGDVADGCGAAGVPVLGVGAGGVPVHGAWVGGVSVHHLHLGLHLPALVTRPPAPTAGTTT